VATSTGGPVVPAIADVAADPEAVGDGARVPDEASGPPVAATASAALAAAAPARMTSSSRSARDVVRPKPLLAAVTATEPAATAPANTPARANDTPPPARPALGSPSFPPDVPGADGRHF
jgi:hypothetical protein